MCMPGGDWYRISKTYRDRVDERVGRLSKLRVGLPPASVDETEAEYNYRAANAIDGLCLDGKTISMGV